MKRILTILAAVLFAAGCVPRDDRQSAGIQPLQDGWGTPTQHRVLITVDQFIAAIESGSTIQTLQPQLGIWVSSSLAEDCALADGRAMRSATGQLCVQRHGSKEWIKIEQVDAVGPPIVGLRS